MALDLQNLTEYTDENKMALIKRSILTGRSMDYMTVQPDIKHTAAINIMDSTLVGQAGGCGWNANGTVELTQRDLSVCPIKVNEATCPEDLEKFWTQKLMNPGSFNEEIPFEQFYAEDKADKIADMNETIIWKGDKNGSGNLALCDGFLKLFDAERVASPKLIVEGNPTGITTGTGITAANIVDIIDKQVELIDADIIDRDDLYIYVGYEVYRLYAKALRDANLFHYNGAEDQGQEFSQMVPGTNVRVVALKGLNNTNRIITSTKENMYIGVDALSDSDEFRIWYSMDNDEVRFAMKQKLGVQVAFPEYVVDFKLA